VESESGYLLGRAVYPSIFHQDPRYFYKGKGSIGSRALYAISAAVIARGDDGRWKPNYSRVLGSFSAAAIFESLLSGLRSRTFVSRLQWFGGYGRGCCIESDPRIPSETDHLACSPRCRRPTIGLPEEDACLSASDVTPAEIPSSYLETIKPLYWFFRRQAGSERIAGGD
jgi:hypothetical protein